jgi:hypothetical protein
MVENANEAIRTAEAAQSSIFKSANATTEAMLRLQKELLARLRLRPTMHADCAAQPFLANENRVI